MGPRLLGLCMIFLFSFVFLGVFIARHMRKRGKAIGESDMLDTSVDMSEISVAEK